MKHLVTISQAESNACCSMLPKQGLLNAPSGTVCSFGLQVQRLKEAVNLLLMVEPISQGSTRSQRDCPNWQGKILKAFAQLASKFSTSSQLSSSLGRQWYRMLITHASTLLGLRLSHLLRKDIGHQTMTTSC